MIDPITFEVLRHRLATIVDEGAAVMRNVSGSPSVAQSNDCNVALLTTAGEGVIIGRTIASHAMSCIQTTKYVLKEYAKNPGIAPGDMFFTNHPYIGTPHQTCGVMVAPIFVGDRIVAWSGAGIHFGDVGGTVPGQVSIGAQSIWDEAMPMPPVKMVEGNVLRRDLEEDFLTRSRTRVQNAVDLKAMIGAHNAMARRIQALAKRYGVEVLVEALDRVVATSETKLRTILREIPDGTWSCENFIDYYDRDELKIYACRLTLSKHGDQLVFDFTKSSRQAPAVVNATFAATEGYLLRAMLGIFGFAVQLCPAAIQRVLTIKTTEGTIVHCAWPAGVCKGTTSVTQSVWTVATQCLSQMLMGEQDLSQSGRGRRPRQSDDPRSDGHRPVRRPVCCGASGMLPRCRQRRRCSVRRHRYRRRERAGGQHPERREQRIPLSCPLSLPSATGGQRRTRSISRRRRDSPWHSCRTARTRSTTS